MNKREIGDALDNLAADVIAVALELTGQYRAMRTAAVLKQAVDTPHRARAQVTAWIASYNAANGSGAVAFLTSCLTAAGSPKTLVSIDAELAALETKCLVLVNHVANDGWTLDQVAAAIYAAVAVTPPVDFLFARLPIPAGYTNVWGEAVG